MAATYRNIEYTALSSTTDSQPDRNSDAPIASSGLPIFSTLKRKITEFLHANYGLLLVLLSEVLFSLVNVAVKQLNSIDPPVPVLELLLIRMCFTWTFSVGVMLYQGVEDPFFGPQGVRLLLLLRGVGGFFGVFGIYQALEWISLSDATVLTFLSPLTTAVCGSILLKETFVPSQGIAAIFMFLGVLLIARPPLIFGEDGSDLELDSQGTSQITSKHRLFAVGISLVGVLGSTVAFICIRTIGKRAHALHSVVSFSSQTVIVSTIGLIATKTPLVLPTDPLWCLFFIQIGVFGFLAQILLTMGFQNEQAGRASMAIYTQIVWATIFERIWFHTTPSFLSIIGTVIIIGSALYVAVNKPKPDTDSVPLDEEVALEEVAELRPK